MCPSFNSFGSTPSVSQLIWDSDLVIPAGKAIESASGEVMINSDGAIQGNITVSGHPLNVISKSVSEQQITEFGDYTFPAVSTRNTALTGSFVLRNTQTGTSRAFNVVFTATDALGQSTAIKTYTYTLSGSSTKSQTVDIVLPVGTTKLNITLSGTSYVVVDSVNILLPTYQTTMVF